MAVACSFSDEFDALVLELVRDELILDDDEPTYSEQCDVGARLPVVFLALECNDDTLVRVRHELERRVAAYGHHDTDGLQRNVLKVQVGHDLEIRGAMLVLCLVINLFAGTTRQKVPLLLRIIP